MPDTTESLIRQIYILAQNRKIDPFLESGDDDFSFAIPGLSRYRVSTYKQRGSLAAVIRVIAFELPDPALLGIPDSILQLTDLTKGMLLVTGPAGSGKSTTLACLIDRINSTRENHIITLEDPLEFLPYPHLIATLFNGCAFGPPLPFTATSTWTWVDHPVSGLPGLTLRAVNTCFHFGSVP